MRILIASFFFVCITTAVHAQDCETDARAAMLDVAHPVPMRQDVVTEMGGTKIESTVFSTPDRTGMSLDGSGKPVSLWQGGKFFSSADGGNTWALISEQSPEQLAQQDDNRKKQAEMATDFSCDYGIELDGRRVHRLQLSYTQIGPNTPVTSQYWVDAENGFPWKVVHEFGGNAPTVITQLNTPEPDLAIPSP